MRSSSPACGDCVLPRPVSAHRGRLVRRRASGVWFARVAGAMAAALALLLLVTAPARAADVGYRDFSYRDVNRVQVPSDDKPQSKLWFQDGSWWALMYSATAYATTIRRLDPASQTWFDTGTVVDARPTARGDALWDGATHKLYV